MKNKQKNKSNFSIVKLFFYPFKGLFFIIYLIYKMAKYLFLGLEYLLYINFLIIKKAFYGILFVCVCVFDVFKLIGKLIIMPFKRKEKTKKIKQIKKEKEIVPVKKEIIAEKKKETVKKEKINKIDKKQLRQEKIKELATIFIEKKEKEKREKQELLEIKKKKNLEKEKEKKEKLRKKKINEEAYVNKNVKLEKPTLKSKLNSFFKNIGLVFVSLGSKITNNSFSKNRRNKKDMKRQILLIDFEGEDAKKSEKKLLYEYVAKDKNGKIIKDYFNAYSKVEVHSYLLSEGYEVYSIRTNKFIQLFHKNSNTNKTKFKNKDLIFFLTQLSTYIKAGIPLVESLRIISRQYKKKSYQKIFRSVIYELTIGENFSTAMEKQGVAFPKLLINMVKTAEMTGSLPEVLDDMANYYTEAEATRKQMITAMTYPTLVFIFAIAVMIFIMVYVVPQFVEIYETMDTELPGITKAILALSSFLTHYYILLILVVIAFIAIFIYSYKKIISFRTMCQWIMMHVPVIKNTIIYNEVTMFTKTFSSLLAHNVPITDCMEILNKITNNEIYKMLILDTIANLARGGKISDAFKDHWAFPVPAYEMIVTGEMTGELSEMMGKVSLYYQDLHKNSVTRIKTFVEPALTIFLTFGVGVILLSIIIPMFTMYSAVQEMG
ncbi:MAG: type II secretion system F family protein [Bacilli bacterium]|nr:type II secretion system F family protein [Bacilli bacterium]